MIARGTTRSTVAAFVRDQIVTIGKSQRAVAAECGYSNANMITMITMIKQGKSKIPLNRIDRLARALEVAPEDLLEMVMREYSPEAWRTIEELMVFRRAVTCPITAATASPLRGEGRS